MTSPQNPKNLAKAKGTAEVRITLLDALRRAQPIHHANQSGANCDNCGCAHAAQQYMTTHTELILDNWRSCEAILARFEEHACNARCEWDAPKNKRPTDVAKQPVRDAVGKTVLAAAGNRNIERSYVVLDSGSRLHPQQAQALRHARGQG